MAGLDVHLLGPFEVLRDGRPVAVSSERLRALLAVLAMSGGQVVSVDAIGTAVWGQETPDSVRRSVHTYVARVRRLLGDDAILTGPGGYRLNIDPEHVDVLRFLRLCGRDETLLDALALWRGKPFEGVGAQWWSDAESPRLLERYLTALEQRVDLDIAADNPASSTAELAVELRELTARYPLRESLWVRLLTVLVRAGRRAEALEAYETIRTRLATELGVDPGPELQRQYAALLAGDTAPPPPRPAAQQLPADPDRFTGRASALAALDELIPDDGTARPIVIAAVHGTGGVGKTALAVHWAHQVRDRFPDGQLFVNLRGYGPGKPLPPSAALDMMLRSLHVPSERIPADLDSRSALFRSLLADRRMLVVLDNARNAAQVRPLLPGSSCLVVVTSRNQLRGLVVRDGAVRITLDELHPTESVALLRRVLPSGHSYADDALAELARLCGQLPLALRIAAEHAARHPGQGLDELLGDLRKQQRRLDVLDSDDPASSVRAVFSWSYRTLDPGSARMFRLLGAHPGPYVSLPAAAALIGGTANEARRLLDRLIDAHLVEQRGHHRYEQHDLIRTYAAELADAVDTQADRDAALRRVFGFYVHSGRNARAVLGRAELLFALEALPPGVTPLEFADDRQALAWFDTLRETTVAAVQLAADRGQDRAAYELAQTLALAFLYYRAYAALLRVQELGMACARRAGNLLAEGSCALTLGTACAGVGDVDRAIAHRERALELFGQAGSVRGQADALELLGNEYSRLGRHTEAIDTLNRSVELARQCGDRRTEPRKLNNLGNAYLDLERFDSAAAAARQALELVGMNRVLESYASDTLGQALTRLGKHDEAVGVYQRALDLCRELGDRWQEPTVLTNLARAEHAAGRPADAREHAELALRIVDEVGVDTNYTGVVRADLVDLLTMLR